MLVKLSMRNSVLRLSVATYATSTRSFTLHPAQKNANQVYDEWLMSQIPKLPGLMVHQEKHLMGYSRDNMFNLVKDVSKYKDFVPFCVKSNVLHSSKEAYKASIVPNDSSKTPKKVTLNLPDTFKAELEIGFPPIKQSYISTVTVLKPKLVRSVSTDMSLFEHLSADWRFHLYDLKGKRIVPDGSTHYDPNCCVIELYVAFKFRSRFYSQLATLFLDQVVKQMVSGFTKRASQLHGPATFSARKI